MDLHLKAWEAFILIPASPLAKNPSDFAFRGNCMLILVWIYDLEGSKNYKLLAERENVLVKTCITSRRNSNIFIAFMVQKPWLVLLISVTGKPYGFFVLTQH